MQTFIKINNVRLIKSSIKKYVPSGENKINIYFNTSRYRVELETFTFDSELRRDNVMDYLDAMFL